MLKLNWIATVSLCALLLVSTTQAQEVSRGVLLASMCDTCHGTGGKGAGSMEDITGVEVADMIELMKAFASGEEESTMMGRHAQGYTDEELQAIAEHYANL